MRSRVAGRWAGVAWWVTDAVVALLSASVAIGTTDEVAGPGHGPVAARTASVVWFAAIAGRRLAPVVALWAAAGATVATALVGHPLTNLSLATALAAALVFRRRPVAGAALLSAPPLAAALTALATQQDAWNTFWLAVLVHACALAWGAWSRVAEIRRAAQQVQERERALAAERARLARDLHDAVGSAVTVMTTHAGAARLTLATGADGAPARVQDSLRSIEDAGRAAMADLDRVLHLLRRDLDGPQELSVRLAELVRAAPPALRARLHHDVVEGAPALPADVRDAVHRSVQEALTNATRYGGGEVEVSVLHGPSSLRVRVRQAPGPAVVVPATRGGGSGLRGVRERVRLLGGTASAGRDPDGGWSVHVELPLAAGAS